VTSEKAPAGKTRPRKQPRKCPICGKPATAESFPFCSPRCARIDLNRWLSGTYVIPGKPEDDAAEEPEE
jgi:endogenous inhibitor of DNA gyrase (YacG/DUF329 family)